MECIILVGGMGTRLKAVSGDTPKPLVLVAERPFVYYIMDYLIDHGVNKIIFATSYKSGDFKSTLGTNYRGVEIYYSVENYPLGTGGGIRQAIEFVSGDNVLIFNGDTYATVDINKSFSKHITSGKEVTLSLFHVSDTSRYGRVNVQDDIITNFSEKSISGPGFINSGVYWINKRALDKQPQSFSFESDYLMKNIDKLGCDFFDGYFIDIGIPDDYYVACEKFSA
ncbi:MAG: sugar phosphate nucleotidyltransferase [Shewanella sp.]